MWHRGNGELSEAEERAIAGFMARMAAIDPRGALPRMPEAGPLWWKAQLLRRWDAERRVQAPLDAMHPIQIAAGLAAAAMLLVWVLPQVLRF